MAAELGMETLLYVRDDLTGLLDLAYGLLVAEPTIERDKRAVVWSGKAAAVAGREEIERDEAAEDYLERLIPRLVELLGSDLPPVERAEAGRALAKLRDPRRGVTTCLGMEMCRVPAGEFWWGGGIDFHQDEETQVEKRALEYPYWISRFPVTQARFGEFAEAGGYREECYWREAREAGVWKEGEVEDFVHNVSIDGPQSYGGTFSLPNHPVVGVTWYEALAFTRWLTERLRDQGLASSWEVRLPSEAEWEKAARGGLELPAAGERFVSLESLRDDGAVLRETSDQLAANPSPKRVYPWGEKLTVDHANYDQTGIGATSAVGCFPRGSSPYGCQEMSGNVWEWSRDFLEGEATDPQARVALRGGSWAFPSQSLPAAIRFGIWARDRNQLFGFRVVLCVSSEHA